MCSSDLKNLSERTPARLSIVDPETLQPACADIDCPEPSIARLSARGDTVYVVMTMPHRGRPRFGYFAYGSGGNSMPVHRRLMQVPGVRHVIVEHTWEPGWNSNRITTEGRRKLGLEKPA